MLNVSCCPRLYKKWKTHETPNSTVNHYAAAKHIEIEEKMPEMDIGSQKDGAYFVLLSCPILLTNQWVRCMLYTRMLFGIDPGHIRIHLYSQNANDNKINSNETNERTPPPIEWVFGANFPITQKWIHIVYVPYTLHWYTFLFDIPHTYSAQNSNLYIRIISSFMFFLPFRSNGRYMWSLYI